jgi:hypothetical protein
MSIETLLKQHRELSPRPLYFDGTHVWCEGVDRVVVRVRYPALAELLRAFGLRQTGYGVTETWEKS